MINRFLHNSLLEYLFLAAIGFVLFTAFAFFSFALTAPNLMLLNWEPYVTFQTTMWNTFFNNRTLLGNTFFSILGGLCIWYFATLFFVSSWKNYWLGVLILGVSIPLLFSSTALSYDVYNYLFNAKMVVVYEADPHTQVALDFAHDDWLRFMHNTHTTAPYGYGWTVLSSVFYSIIQTISTSFLFAWFTFRLFIVVAHLGVLLSIFFFIRPINRQKRILLTMVAIHPLLLIESISSIHNDMWMMLPALTSLAMLAYKEKIEALIRFSRSIKPTKAQNTLFVFALLSFSLLLLIFSISIKLATSVLIPIWLILAQSLLLKYGTTTLSLHGKNINKKISKTLKSGIKTLYAQILNHWAVLASMALFAPLLTERSKWFLPWYIIWSFVWIPFFPIKSIFSTLWISWLLAISTSVLFRYLPFLYSGSYEDPVFLHQIMITWIGAVALLPLMYILQNQIFNRKK